MKTSTALRLEKQELSNYSSSLKSIESEIEKKNDRIKSRLGFVYFIAFLSSIILLLLK